MLVFLYLDFYLFEKHQGNYSRGKTVVLALIIILGFIVFSSGMECILDLNSMNFLNTLYNEAQIMWRYSFAGVGGYMLVYICFPPREVGAAEGETEVYNKI